MYARVASFENRDLSLVDDLIGTVRERIAAGRTIPGARRLLMLLDRQGGTALGITLFETEDAIREAEHVFAPTNMQKPPCTTGSASYQNHAGQPTNSRDEAKNGVLE